MSKYLIDSRLISTRVTDIVMTLPILCLIVILGAYLKDRYSIGIDDQVIQCLSGHHRFFLIDHWARDFKRDDLIAFRADWRMSPHFKEGTYVIKKVKGLAEDLIDRDGDQILINRSLIAEGRPLMDKITANGLMTQETIRLGSNQFWVMGDHRLSFDSRYWGPVYPQQIVGKAYVLPI